MSQPANIGTTRNLAAVAILFAMIAQFAMLTHSVLVEHSPGEHCETCIGQDRTDDTVVAQVAIWASQTAQPVLRIERATAFVFRAVSAVHNRGPPLL